MRYTTIVDIRDLPLYRNPSVRQLYLHLVLVSGYHDSDLDRVAVSVRGLASQTGLTISAVRHALDVMTKAGLVRREGGALMVTKYVLKDGIPKRARTKKEQQEQQQSREREQQEVESKRREIQEQNKIIMEQFTVDDLIEWSEDLKTKRSGSLCYHKGCKCINDDRGREYLAKWIEYKQKHQKQ